MSRLLSIKVARLKVGDIIFTDKGARVPVTSITPCSQRGIPRIHVNKTDCYDTISTQRFTIQRKTNDQQ